MQYNSFKRFFFITYLSFIFIFGVFSAFILHSLVNLGGIRKLEKYTPPIPTEVLDIKGRRIAQFYYEKREIIEYNDLPVHLVEATFATEDERFASHYGFNPWRMMKALWNDIIALKAEQGGSTITIQLSKLLFLSHQKKISRKIKELWYSIQLEKQYSKKEILLFYFNQINYGHGCYGIKVAANFFFNKKIGTLDLLESALLVGIPKSPTYYSPFRFPKYSMKRHRVVLYSMLNKNIITKQALGDPYLSFWRRYTTHFLSPQSSVSDTAENHAPYFIEYIRKKLEKDLGKRVLYQKGLKIHTTLNLDHQKVAQKTLWNQLEKQNKFDLNKIRALNGVFERDLYNSLTHWSQLLNLPNINVGPTLHKRNMQKKLTAYIKSLNSLSLLTGVNKLNHFLEQVELDPQVNLEEKVEGSLISLEPSTGYVTTMVGGSGFNYNNQLNRSVQIKRQIGSIIKPFVYGAAIDKNLIHASTMIVDEPMAFGEIKEKDGQYYIPKNYTGSYLGKISVREALKKSVNVCAVKTLYKIGLDDARHYAARIFRSFTDQDMNEKFPKDLTMVLGSGIFSPLSVATAYAVIANGGKSVVPKTIRYITDRNGEIIRNYEALGNQAEFEQIMDSATAYILYSILSDVFKPGGTAYRPALLDGYRHYNYSFGKTGTSSNWKDAWFVGANRHLSTCVWIGYDSGKSLGQGRAGGKMSAPVWIEYQKEILKEKKPLIVKKPKSVVTRQICRYSGLLAGPYSQERDLFYEYYKKGTEPLKYSEYRYNQFREELRFQRIISRKKKPTSDVNRFFSVIKNRN